MASQVKSPKSVDTRSKQSIADTSLANAWKLSTLCIIGNSEADELLLHTNNGRLLIKFTACGD